MARSSRPFVGALAGCLAIACSCVATTAEAYCRTSVCNGDTASVCVPSSPDDCGIPLFWPSDCIGFSIQQDASKDVTLEVATTVFDTAFSNWTEAPCAAGGTPHIQVVDAGSVECHTVEYNQKKPNANIIMFDDDSWPYAGSVNTIALTTVSYDRDSGAIYDADMELNSFQVMFTTSDTGVVYDLPSIAQHETGHFLGLAHSPDSDATMFASYEMGTTTLRTLSSDDIAAICAAYPPGDAIPSDCDSTPRHGFSSLCGADESDEVIGGCCAVAPGGSSDGRAGLLGALMGVCALIARSHRRRRSLRS